MKIIFTGSSSFTGYWFITSLLEAGHEVIATFKGNPDLYKEIRKVRVNILNEKVLCIYNCAFGSEIFIDIISKQNKIDMICHHDADVTNYKSPEFNVITALERNSKNITSVLNKLRDKRCDTLLFTGSIFESNEGAGSDGLRAFSPYGLSKGLTADYFRYYTGEVGMKMGKFVIPNPFGPFEEPRFTTFLVKRWQERKIPRVATPDYVRDNIHVSLLSSAYTWFAENLKKKNGVTVMHPSCYPESQRVFATRFAKEMSHRIGVSCPLYFAEQHEFTEPKIRVNTDSVMHLFTDWSEKKAWDESADYYKTLYKF